MTAGEDVVLVVLEAQDKARSGRMRGECGEGQAYAGEYKIKGLVREGLEN